jgi:hypothetical protein
MVLKFIAFAGVLSSIGCIGMDLHFDDGVKGSGKVIQEQRKVSGFSKIDMKGAYDVEVKVGPATKVELKGDDNLLKLIETSVENGSLVLSSKKNLRPTKGLRVTISTPNLTAFLLKGAGDVNIEGINTKEFTVDLRGAGDLLASGKADKVNAVLKGAGDMNLYGLRASNVDAELSGAGDMNVWASKHLKARMSGVGDLSYKGNPATVDKSKSGIGSISAED